MAYSMILAIYIYVCMYVAGHIFHRISKDKFNDMYVCIYLWDKQYDMDKGISYGT